MLDSLAFSIGLVGTFLWAMGYKPGWEGVAWLLSSFLWIAHAWATDQAPLAARDAFGAALYCMAIWRTLVRPWLEKRRAMAGTEVSGGTTTEAGVPME